MSVVRIRREGLEPHPLDAMPFMKPEAGRRNCWCPPLADDYQQNFYIGRTFRWDMADYLRRYDSEGDQSHLLGWVARDMIEVDHTRDMDGMICGFMAAIAGGGGEGAGMSHQPTTPSTRRNGIANPSTLPGLPSTFIPIPVPFAVSLRRPRSRGPETTGQLLGEVCRGQFFQHWCVQGEGSVVYMCP